MLEEKLLPPPQPDVLEKCALSDDQCENIALEVVESENIIEGGKHSFERLQILLGLREPESQLSRLLPTGNMDSESADFFNNRQVFKATQVGRRKPKRDLIN